MIPSIALRKLFSSSGLLVALTGLITTAACLAASFPLQSAFISYFENGFSTTFMISGSCTGSGTVSISPATTHATFNGTSGYSEYETYGYTYKNCTPANQTATGYRYFDSNHLPIAFLGQTNASSWVYSTPASIPTSVAVGNSGTIGNLTLFSDNTLKTRTGTGTYAYKVNQGTTSGTVIVVLTSTFYNTAGALELTQQDNYQLATSGPIIPTTSVVQYYGSSNANLTYTYANTNSGSGSGSSSTITDGEVFAFATSNYPALFAGTPENGTAGQYTYQYYPASGNFLGLDQNGEIYLLGPQLTKNVIEPIGTTGTFGAYITAWEESSSFCSGNTPAPTESLGDIGIMSKYCKCIEFASLQVDTSGVDAIVNCTGPGAPNNSWWACELGPDTANRWQCGSQ